METENGKRKAEKGRHCNTYIIVQACKAKISLVPRPIPSFSMLHAEKWEEGLVREVTCGVSCMHDACIDD